jgi:caffeic acid 3-O-methyltransferase
MQYTNSRVLTLVINAAMELDIFGIIARTGPGSQISSAEIASQLPATKNPDFPSKLDR